MGLGRVWLGTTALVLLPLRVLAEPAVCLTDQLGNRHLLEALAISPLGYISVVGEITFSGDFNDPASCPNAPLSGTGRFLPDGTVQVGYTAFASTAECLPVNVQLRLSVATLSGSGSLDEVNSAFFTPLTVTPTPGACVTPVGVPRDGALAPRHDRAE